MAASREEIAETTGRSVPASRLNSATASSLASRPSTARPTSPGRSCAVANTIMLSRRSVISARPRRLAT